MDMTVAQVRALKGLHEEFVAAEGRERAHVLRAALAGKARDFTSLLSDLYGDA